MMSGFKKNDDTTTSKDKARKELEENISKRLDDIKDLIRKYDEGELNYDAEAVRLFPHLGFPANKKVVSKKNNTCAIWKKIKTTLSMYIVTVDMGGQELY